MSEHGATTEHGDTTGHDDDKTLSDGVPMSFEERREDELRRAPKSDPGDAAPRVAVSRSDAGNVRIDVADTAAIRPGKAPRRSD